MKFGVREICDVTFKPLQDITIGLKEFRKGAPVLYIDSAKTSTIEGAATTVYATGGKGNSRLIAWEGEKTLTFTVEDALLSPIGFAILSGAGLFDSSATEQAYVHTTAIAEVIPTSTQPDATLSATIYLEDETIATNAPIFVMEYENGSIGSVVEGVGQSVDTEKDKVLLTFDKSKCNTKQVFVDFYVKKKSLVTEMQIDAENFGGFYYVEGSTLFRRESDGKDLPAEIVFPKVKVQSNFTFSMSSSGDPSTFSFVMDALPGYTWFNKSKKVLCAMQVIDDTIRKEVGQAVTLAAENGNFDDTKDSYGESTDTPEEDVTEE